MCEMCMVFHGFSRFSKRRRFCERQGDRYSPSPSFADGMAPSNIIKTGFQHNPHAAVDPKSDPKNIRGCSSNGRALASHNVLFPREQTLFFFPFFFAGRRPKAEKPPNTHHTHTHHHHPARRDETRRDETLARALDAIGEVVRGLLVSRAQPGFPHHQQQQQQRILSCILAAFCVLLLCTHPP